MKKFEVGRRYNDKETPEQQGTCIEIVKRTEKTVTLELADYQNIYAK